VEVKARPIRVCVWAVFASARRGLSDRDGAFDWPPAASDRLSLRGIRGESRQGIAWRAWRDWVVLFLQLASSLSIALTLADLGHQMATLCASFLFRRLGFSRWDSGSGGWAPLLSNLIEIADSIH
jgi:hypothetical protein